ncbi:MAG: hypothetical protein KQA36_03460 [Candidatus Aenigmarchaeota archaeon]|nr:hypothetical protein [Candidatus Aenigmarchaeota archaeon]
MKKKLFLCIFLIFVLAQNLGYSQCTDSDGGYRIDIYGCVNVGGNQYCDRCASQNTLYEYYCTNSYPYYNYGEASCPSGQVCSNGACVAISQTSTTTSTISACPYTRCESVNPIGCRCGNLITEGSLRWCCVGTQSNITSSTQDECVNRCNFQSQPCPYTKCQAENPVGCYCGGNAQTTSYSRWCCVMGSLSYIVSSKDSCLIHCGTTTTSTSTIPSQCNITINRVDVTPQPASTQVTFVAVGNNIEQVRVRIYDSTGAEIFTGNWINGNSFTWNLRDNNGIDVRNGLYYYLMYARGCGREIEAGRGTFNVERGAITTTTTTTTTTTAPSQMSCAGRCGTYDPQAPCQCDLQCRINNDCCSDVCRACPNLPFCQVTTIPTTIVTTIPTTLPPGPTTIPTTIVTTIPTTTTTTISIPASCAGRCGNYNPQAPCQCDNVCHLYRGSDGCCQDICRACPTHPSCLVTTIPQPTTIPTTLPQVYISCPACRVGNCTCLISGCNSGYVEIYLSQDCGKNITSTYNFTGNSITLAPEREGIIYLKVICDTGQSSVCTPITVSLPPITTTTTTIPEVKVTCEKSVILIGEKINCSIQNCVQGTWFASNKQGKPLESPILLPIPPFSIEIGPIISEGIISVVGVCREPSVTSSFDLKVEKGVEINCSSCFVESSCSCEIKNCTYGWLYLTNSKENPLNDDIVRVISTSPYSLVFKPYQAGEVLLTLECYSPYKLTRSQRIEVKNVCSGAVTLNISPSVVSTSSLTRAYISGLQYCEGYNVTIRKDSCSGELACTAKANENCQFSAPQQEGNYTYYACIDKNNDNDYDDPGEQTFAKIEVKKIEERFKFINISCTPTKCMYNIENTIKEPGIVLIRLVSIPEGRIHYAANDDISPGFSGRREVPLLKIRDCTLGAQLKVVAIAFKQSDVENELDRIVKVAFTC